MRYIFQFTRILAFCLLGELLHYLLPLPVPASVYGLILLLAALKTGLVKIEQVREAGKFLIGILLLLFLPGAVGVIEQFDLFAKLWVPLLVALFPMTVVVFLAAGKVTDFVERRMHHE
ncbi:MAG: CidA/LrgA family protein [Lachnospiraceae bacterium]|nr:CidA/LrgA family protein [Lachnospiraceae bacterium]